MKKIQVLISTYNGEKFLEEQLDSVLSQIGVNVSILVRDDGSTDSTLNILAEYKKKGKLDFFIGENIGYGKSFLKLVSLAEEADYYAFCDQDDVWISEKLIKAIQCLDKLDVNKPRLYFSNLILVNEKLDEIGYKDFDNIKINLFSSIIRPRVAGCTMVFDKKLLELANVYNFKNYKNIISHDGWIYRLCLAVGGNIFYDKTSYLYYRQHGSNVTGVSQGIRKRYKNTIVLFKKNKNSRLDISQIILSKYEKHITLESKEKLYNIVKYKDSFYNTLQLMKNKEFRSGICIIDIITKISLLCRKF